MTYLDGIRDLDIGVGISDGSSVMGNDVGDLVLSELLLNNLEELEGSLLLVNLVGDESSLDVVEDSEVLVGLLNCNNIHLSKRESVVSSDLSVNLDESFLILDNLSSLVSGVSVLESLLEEHIEGNALSKLMRSR